MANNILEVLSLPLKPLQALGLPVPFAKVTATPSTPPEKAVSETRPFGLSRDFIFQTVNGFKTAMMAIAAPDRTIEGTLVPTGLPIVHPKTVNIPAATPIVDGALPNSRANANPGIPPPSAEALERRTGHRRITAIGGY